MNGGDCLNIMQMYVKGHFAYETELAMYLQHGTEGRSQWGHGGLVSWQPLPWVKVAVERSEVMLIDEGLIVIKAGLSRVCVWGRQKIWLQL